MSRPLNSPPLLTTRQVSQELERRGIPRSVSTLERLRCYGGGPPFRRFGRVVRYRYDELESWIEAMLSAPMRSTTSPLPAAK
jgi:hypothetical protein